LLYIYFFYQNPPFFGWYFESRPPFLPPGSLAYSPLMVPIAPCIRLTRSSDLSPKEDLGRLTSVFFPLQVPPIKHLCTCQTVPSGESLVSIETSKYPRFDRLVVRSNRGCRRCILTSPHFLDVPGLFPPFSPIQL